MVKFNRAIIVEWNSNINGIAGYDRFFFFFFFLIIIIILWTALMLVQGDRLNITVSSTMTANDFVKFNEAIMPE